MLKVEVMPEGDVKAFYNALVPRALKVAVVDVVALALAVGNVVAVALVVAVARAPAEVGGGLVVSAVFALSEGRCR